eukprot:gene18675-25193_t
MTTTPAPARKVPIVCHGHSRPIVEVNYSNITPDGYFLASASKDGQPMLRHGDSGDWYGTFSGHKGCVWSCVLNGPALLCATGSADFSARVWDACTGTQLHGFQHKHIVRSTAFSHGSKLTTGGMEKMIRIFDLAQPEVAPVTLPNAEGGIRNLVWLQDDKLVLCALSDKPGINVYDTRSLQLVQTLETKAPITSVEISYDQQYMTTAEGNTVRFWDTSSLRMLKEHTLKHSAEAATYCPAKNRFAAGGEDMWVRLYDFNTGAELECNKGHHGAVHTIRFSPTYESYASGSEDGTIRIWHLDGPGS